MKMRFIVTTVACAAALSLGSIAVTAQEEPADPGDYKRLFPVETRAEPRDLSAVELEELARHPLGSRENPVRCYTPPNETAYLSRLRCANGKAPKFERVGFEGIGPYGTALDAFELTCRSWTGKKTFRVYLDMSHVGVVETRPLPGFEIEEPAEAELSAASPEGE